MGHLLANLHPLTSLSAFLHSLDPERTFTHAA